MIRRSAAVAIAVTLQQLAAGRTIGWTPDQMLVIEALRRSSTALEGATMAELGGYLRAQTETQALGTLSNVKGIFHELLIVRAENLDGEAIMVRPFDHTNHPGADLEYIIDGQVIGQVQVKAIQDTDAIITALSAYSDIDILATSEAWHALDGRFADQVADSGFGNADITQTARETLDQVADQMANQVAGDTLGDVIQDGAAMSILVCGAVQARAVLTGKGIDRAALRSSLELMGLGVGTALVIDTILGLA